MQLIVSPDLPVTICDLFQDVKVPEAATAQLGDLREEEREVKLRSERLQGGSGDLKLVKNDGQVGRMGRHGKSRDRGRKISNQQS